MMPTNPDFPTTPSLEEMEQLLERKPTIQDQVDSRYTPGRFADNVDRTMLDNPYTKEMTENSLANRFQQRVDDEKYYDEGQYLNRGKTLGLNPEYMPDRELSLEEIRVLGAPDNKAITKAMTRMMYDRK
jgi:hypothetical protein